MNRNPFSPPHYFKLAWVFFFLLIPIKENLFSQEKPFGEMGTSLDLNKPMGTPIIKEAEKLLKRGDYSQAIDLLNGEILKNPTYYRFYSYRAKAYAKLGRIDEALADLNKSISLNPRVKLDHRNRGNIYYQKKDYQKAADDYQIFISNNNDPYSINSLGRCWYHLGHFEKSIPIFDQAKKINPEDPENFYFSGMAFYRLKKFTEAIPQFEKAISLKSKSERACKKFLEKSLVRLKQQ